MGSETATLVYVVIAVLTTAGGGLAWYIRRHDTRKDPLPRTAAEVAIAKEALGIIVASRDALTQDMARQGEELAQERARGDRHEQELVQLRKEHAELHDIVDEIRSRLTAAARYIETLLRWGRAGGHDPEPDVPEGLADLIDPTVRDRT